MKFVYLILAISCFDPTYKYDRDETEKMYLGSIRYLEHQYDNEYFARFDKDCSIAADRSKKRIMISNKRIDIKIWDVFCDVIKKKYVFHESCGKMLAKDSEEIKTVKDSISTVIKDYHMSLSSNNSHEVIKNDYSNQLARNSGVVFYFSAIHNRSLSVEIKTGCSESFLEQGASAIYFFIFNEDDSIKEVYTGTHNYD
jgi:hypothetical protein